MDFVISDPFQNSGKKKGGQSEKKGFKQIDRGSIQLTQLCVDTPYFARGAGEVQNKMYIKHFRISKKKSPFFVGQEGRTTFDGTGYQNLLSPPPSHSTSGRFFFLFFFSFYIFQDSSKRGPKNEKKKILVPAGQFFQQLVSRRDVIPVVCVCVGADGFLCVVYVCVRFGRNWTYTCIPFWLTTRFEGESF